MKRKAFDFLLLFLLDPFDPSLQMVSFLLHIPVFFEYHLNGGTKFFTVKGFLKVGKWARLLGLIQNALILVGGQVNDRYASVFPDPIRGFDSAELPVELDVHQNQIRVILTRDLDRFLTRIHGIQHVKSEPLQRVLKVLCHDGLVLNDEDG